MIPCPFLPLAHPDIFDTNINLPFSQRCIPSPPGQRKRPDMDLRKKLLKDILASRCVDEAKTRAILKSLSEDARIAEGMIRCGVDRVHRAMIVGLFDWENRSRNVDQCLHFFLSRSSSSLLQVLGSLFRDPPGDQGGRLQPGQCTDDDVGQLRR